jgi:hypothetical protein
MLRELVANGRGVHAAATTEYSSGGCPQSRLVPLRVSMGPRNFWAGTGSGVRGVDRLRARAV